MSIASTPIDIMQGAPVGPSLAHAWCTCFERDGVAPVPSLCGQSHRETTPDLESWPDDRMSCALCSALIQMDARCLRCGGPE